MEQEIFVDLDRRIQTTATNRFNASSRVRKHDKFSLWTVIFFSLGLILASIFGALNVELKHSPLFINVSSIFLSITILTISTALSMSNFGARAEKFLDCGRELHALALKFKPIINNPDAKMWKIMKSFKWSMNIYYQDMKIINILIICTHAYYGKSHIIQNGIII